MDPAAPSAILVSQSLRALIDAEQIGAVKPILPD